MNKKVLIIVLMIVVVLSAGTYFVLKQTGILADENVATGVTLNGDTAGQAVFSVNTGANKVNAGDTVTFTVNLLDLDNWPGITNTGINSYFLAGKVFDGVSASDPTKNVLDGYNFYQPIDPYYSTSSSLFSNDKVHGCVNKNRSGSCKTTGGINGVWTKAFDNFKTLTYQIETVVPAAIAVKDNQLVSSFDLYGCTAPFSTAQFADNYNRRFDGCSVTKAGITIHSQKLASSGEVKQTVDPQKLADIAAGKTITFNRGEDNIPQLYTVPTGDQTGTGYMAITYKNIGQGASPMTYLDLAVKNVNNSSQSVPVMDIDKVYYIDGDAKSDLRTREEGSVYSFYDGFNITSGNFIANTTSVRINNGRNTNSSNYRFSEVAWTNQNLIEITDQANALGMSYVVTNDTVNKLKNYTLKLGSLDAGKSGVIVVKIKSVSVDKPDSQTKSTYIAPRFSSILANVANPQSADKEEGNNAPVDETGQGLGIWYNIHFSGATTVAETGNSGAGTGPTVIIP
jgi:hypothetical protein